MLHVHINHGESDKQSMASNNAKSYDRVFVAGEAAVQRHATGLLEFDLDRLVRIGRPQLDLHREPVLAPSARRTVLYAPTWEGDADYNNYSSVDTIGPEIVERVLAVPDVRLVYKPHPRVATSDDPGIRSAHRRIVGLVARAAARDRCGRAPLADRRRHPGRHAGLRRDGHRRLVGGAGLALPAHRAPAADRRPPRRPRAAAAGRAGEPGRGRHRLAQRARADRAAHRPAGAGRAAPGPHRDAPPLLRRRQGRRQHRPVPRRVARARQRCATRSCRDWAEQAIAT